MIGEVDVTAAATVLRLTGELDLVSVDNLRAAVDGLVADESSLVVVDLSDVRFCDLACLTVIIGAADAVREQGRQLLVRGASRSVRRVCALLNAEDVLMQVIDVA